MPREWEAATELEQRLAARDRAAVIIEAMPVPVLTLDQALRVVSANRAFCDFIGLARQAVLHRELPALMDDEPLRAPLRAWLERALAKGGLADPIELEYWTASEGRRTLALGGRTIPSDHDQQLMLVTVENVTEPRRRQEELLREQAGRAQRLLNEAGRLLLAEPLDSTGALAKLARLVIPELGDMCAIDLLDGDRLERVAFADRLLAPDAPPPALAPESAVRGLAAADESAAVSDLERDEADVKWLAWMRALGMRSGLGVPLRAGSMRGAVWLGRREPRRDGRATDLAVAEGLSQRAGLAVERSRLYAQATSAVRAREEFLSIAAHELRTPLTALHLQLDMLLRALQAEGNARLVERVRRALRQSRRMAALIDNLLSVSRLMAGKMVLQREPMDLAETAGEVVERLAAEAERAGCKVELRVQGPVRGSFDPIRVEQILTNLLTNAFRYAPGTEVMVEVEGDAKRARVRVRDRGPGLPAHHRQNIFERFETAGQRITSGLGLGLYISRQLAEAHGGTIALERSDVGASFLVELPRDAKP